MKEQEEIDEFWKRIAAQIEEEVLENTWWRMTNEKQREEEASLRSGGWSVESRNIILENGVKVVGQEFSRGSGSISCSESKACRKFNREGRNGAAAKNETHEGHDKENQSEGKNGCEQQLGIQ